MVVLNGAATIAVQGHCSECDGQGGGDRHWRGHCAVCEVWVAFEDFQAACDLNQLMPCGHSPVEILSKNDCEECGGTGKTTTDFTLWELRDALRSLPLAHECAIEPNEAGEVDAM